MPPRILHLLRLSGSPAGRWSAFLVLNRFVAKLAFTATNASVRVALDDLDICVEGIENCSW